MRQSDYRGAREEFSASSAGVTETTGSFLPTIVTSTGTVTLDNTSICRWSIQGTVATVVLFLLVQAVAAPTGSFNVRGFPNVLIPFGAGSAGFVPVTVFASTMTAGGGSSFLSGRLFNGPPVSLTLFIQAGGTATTMANLVQANTSFLLSVSYLIA